MPKISQSFPSNYARADEIKGKRLRLEIAEIREEDIGDGDHKLVVYFKGTKKGVVLNKTNAMLLAEEYGDDTDGWIGKPVIVTTAKVSYQGRMVDGIRFEIPPSEAKPLPKDKGLDDDMNDSIPF